MKKIFYFVLTLLFLLFLIPAANAGEMSIDQTYWNNPTKIKTYIPFNHKYTAKFKRACAEWSRLTKNGIIFKYVGTPKEAQIRVYFVDKMPPALKQDSAAGLTRAMFSKEGQLGFSEIWIADYVKQKRLSDDEVYTSMLHELGHAIGLGHSENPNSIMYPNTSKVKTMEISKEDLAILAKKYKWKK